MIDKYRAVFMSPLGLEVLGDILTTCHFGCTLDPDNPANVAEYNVGVTILNRCGVFHQGTLPQVLNAFTAITPQEEKR